MTTKHDDLQQLLDIYRLTPNDLILLESLASQAERSVGAIVESFYTAILSHPQLAERFTSSEHIERVKAAQRVYILSVFSRTIHPTSEIEIGNAHARIGLEPKWYVGSVALLLSLIRAHMPGLPSEAYDAIERRLLLGIGLALQAYASSRAEMEAQAAKLRRTVEELGTPILEVGNGVIAVPVIGTVDTTRAATMTERVLTAIHVMGADSVILDLTGVDIVDTGTADHIAKLATSIGLLGSRCAISGLQPPVARTMASLGIDLGEVVRCKNMKQAIGWATARERGTR